MQTAYPGTIKIRVEVAAIGQDEIEVMEDMSTWNDFKEVLGRVTSKVVEVNVNAFLDTVETVAMSFQNKMQTLQQQTSINEATVEFGMMADLEGNVYVFKLGSEANLKVSLKWNLANTD